MDDRSARRDLALVAVTVVGLSRLLEPPLIWLVAARCCSGRCCSARSRSSPTRSAPVQAVVRRPDRVAHPPVGRRGRVPRRDPARARSGSGSCPALGGDVADRRPDARARGAHQSRGRRADRRRPHVRSSSRSCSSPSSAFTGVAALVPGGLVQHGGRPARPRANLLVLAAGDALVAGPARLPGRGAAGHRRSRRRSGRR